MSGSRNNNNNTHNQTNGTYDAGTYLATHYNHRRPENRAASNAVQHRANEAREAFKRRHTVVLPPNQPHSSTLSGSYAEMMEGGNKHSRRLGNNQKSADAKKVYNHTLRKEAKKRLQLESERRKRLEQTLHMATEQSKRDKRNREARREPNNQSGSSSEHGGSSSSRRR